MPSLHQVNEQRGEPTTKLWFGIQQGKYPSYSESERGGGEDESRSLHQVNEQRGEPTTKLWFAIRWVFGSFLLFFTLTIQANSYYCSGFGTNGYIQTGDSMSTVQNVCGQPTSVSKSQTPSSKQQKIQSLVYSPRIINSGNSNYPNTYNKQYQVSDNAIAFLLVDDKLTAIRSSKNRGASPSSWQCPQGVVKLNMSLNDVLSYCGQPTTVSTNTKTVQIPSYEEVTWVYQKNQYLPPMEMSFKEGKLVGVKNN